MSGVSWAPDLGGARIVPDELVRAAVRTALAHGGRPRAQVDVVFVGEAFLRDLHARHLDDPAPTDVISFDLGEEGGGPAGEVYVSVDRAREVALGRGGRAERELLLYVVHGVLHLCGYDDHADAERARMRAAEAAVLGLLGFEPDAGPHELDPESS